MKKIHSHNSGKGIRGFHSWEWTGTGIPAHPWCGEEEEEDDKDEEEEANTRSDYYFLYHQGSGSGQEG